MNQQRDEEALLGGGCFWCLEALYTKIEGILEVQSGYAGGERLDPTYEEVCSGTTGHAEVVQLRFAPPTITYPTILELFWKVHDPTSLNRQGADVGSQYRSVIFYYNELQRSQAEQSMAEEQKKQPRPLVTQLFPAPHFYPAESRHQRYFERHPAAPYCNMVIRPKLRQLGYRS